jgi:ABC-type bacteriocin/lantibiotic exporter with double-glycine peptidase domain
VTLFRSRALVRLQLRLDERMMLDFVEHLLSLPFSFFPQRPRGDLVARLNSNTVVRDILSQQLVSLLLDGLMILGYLTLMLATCARLALVVSGFGIVQAAIAFGFVPGLRRLAEEIRAQSQSQSYLIEALSGVKTIKAFAAEGRVYIRWKKLFTAYLAASLRNQERAAQITTAVSCTSLAAPLTLLLLGTLYVMQGDLTLGKMLGFNVLAAAFLSPLAAVVANIQRLQVARLHLDRVHEIFSERPEQHSEGGQDPGDLSGRITLDRLSFSYGRGGPLVIRDVSVEIKPETMVAIVGRSGSGKSTLASLLFGLYFPNEGRVLLDGHDLATLDLNAVRRQMGMVVQGGFLFSESIRRNLAFADPSLNLDRIQHVAEMADIASTINSLPMGYDTVLSEAADNISGGQRQRLCIARAIAHQPRILVLDEATSELDPESEAHIYKALTGLRCTRIVISHRLSAVRNADSILVLADGTIAESGTHDELIGAGGAYAELVRYQDASGPGQQRDAGIA